MANLEYLALFGLIGFLVFRIYFSKVALPLFGIPGTITDKQRKLLKELGQNKTKDLSKEQGTALISTCLFLNKAYSKLGLDEEEIKRNQFQKSLAFLLKNDKFKDFLTGHSKSLKGGEVEQWLNNNSKDIQDFIVSQFKLNPISLDIPSPTNKTQAKKSFREYLQSVQLNNEDIRDE